MANIVDPSEMIDESQLAIDALMSDDQSQEQETETPPEAPPEPPKPFFHMDGEDFTEEDVRQGILRQRDYTQKTQALAADREKVADLEHILTVWDTKPEERPNILQALAKAGGVDFSAPTPQTSGLKGTYNPSDSTPEWDQRGYENANELMLHQTALAAESRAAKAEETVLQLIQKFEGMVGEQAATKAQEVAAQTASQEIAQKYGLKGVTPQLVQDAMRTTGLSDPEAAFLKAQGPKLFDLARGQKEVSAPEQPNTAPAAAGGRTFDPKLYNAGERVLLMEKGFIPRT